MEGKQRAEEEIREIGICDFSRTILMDGVVAGSLGRICFNRVYTVRGSFGAAEIDGLLVAGFPKWINNSREKFC